MIRFTLPAAPPFKLDLTVWALKRRSANEIDDWNGKNYMRVFIFDDVPVIIRVSQKKKENRISVSAASKVSIPRLKSKVSTLLNWMFGLDLDLRWFYDLATEDAVLKPLVLQFKGVKPPRFPSLFEAFVNAIACQQLSLEAGFSLLNKITHRYGRPFKENNRTYYAFPEPKQIMKCKPGELMKLGFSRHKSDALISLAWEMCHHKEKFHCLETLSNEELISFFCSLKGIGRWSAEYVLLRGLGRTEILPGDDVAIHKNIKNLLKLRKNPTYETIKSVEKKWHPYAGIIYFHFLLKKISEKYRRNDG